MFIDRNYQLLLSLPLKITLKDFLTLKDFQICPEDMDFNSGLLLTIFAFFLKDFLISTKNLSRADSVIFRRCFRSSSLSLSRRSTK